MVRNSKAELIAYMGPEPEWGKGKLPAETFMGRAFNWYNAMYEDADAKRFILEYMGEHPTFSDGDIAAVRAFKPFYPYLSLTYGWIARMLSHGALLEQRRIDQLHDEIRKVIPMGRRAPKAQMTDETKKSSGPDIQRRIREQVRGYLATLETEVDDFLEHFESDLDVPAWFSQMDVGSPQCKQIAKWFQDKYLAELLKVKDDRDDDLREAYSFMSWKQLDSYIAFVNSIIHAAESRGTGLNRARKVRARKVKPAAKLVETLKCKASSSEFKVSSVDAVGIVGAQSLFVFNTKNRVLFRYVAEDQNGLGVKGTTLTGFDKNLSIGKTLRKPLVQIPEILKAGKVKMKKFLQEILAKEKIANGRINTHCILVRAVK